MKRKLALIIMLCVLTLAVNGCGSKTSNQSNDALTDSEVEITDSTKSNDEIKNYLVSLAPERRGEFLYFWQQTTNCCNGIEFELRKIKNEDSYEFDPTDESQIPETVKDVYEFSKLKQIDYTNVHKDYKITIKGVNVTLFIDGIKYFPTDYSYNDISNMIQSLSEE